MRKLANNRIAIVAGEASGDLLGAGLIAALRALQPGLRFEGVAGPRMQEAGCRALAGIDELSVMGLSEVLRHLPRLLRLRARLACHWRAQPPAVMIGIDAPDFNLGLERRLKQAGIPTVHYVSPSVWAWRQGRVRGIRRAVDLMLTLFPFEAAFYRDADVPVRYVGHPLADSLAPPPDRAAARSALGLQADDTVIALMPGSRTGEVRALGRVFAETAAWLAARRPELRYIAPLVNDATHAMFAEMLKHAAPGVAVTLQVGGSQQAIAAADAVLVASGTATLECLLLRRPMVVAYRLAATTYTLLKHLRLIKVTHVALPNLLAGEQIVPEFIQHAARPGRLGPALLDCLSPITAAPLMARYDAIHAELQRDAHRDAAKAVLALLGVRREN